MQYDFGVVGIGVMGANLALNMESRGFSVAVYNASRDKVEAFLAGAARGRKIAGTTSPQELVESLARPRRILVMVPAGNPVDSVVSALRPLLEPGDILIDGGNSHYPDTERRVGDLEPAGIRFVGMGVSGGEEGALRGPSLMPGGDPETYRILEPVLTSIAAKTESGPCVTYVGARSAGHFVKMVHNGIEYGDMQLIAEAYSLLHDGLGLDAERVADTFAEWNRGELESFLIEITSEIVRFPDDRAPSGVLVDRILDKAGQKGTGRWTCEAALELGVPIPTLAAAVDARLVSASKELRMRAAKLYETRDAPKTRGAAETQAGIDEIRAALYAAKMCAYAQGFDLLQRASTAFNYGLRQGELARIWKGGCIIRAAFLDKIRSSFERDPALPNLLLDAQFAGELQGRVEGWRRAVGLGQKLGLPVPALSASLAYFDSLRSERLPANLIQAQRDYFGAHTYERTDREGSFHTDWSSRGS
jgi:6-phosphogluconate dehydrogenase